MAGVTDLLIAAVYDPITAVAERLWYADHRAALVDGLAGDCLDLGAGTGAMFPYYARTQPDSVTAVEPSPHMRRRAIARAAELGLAVTVVDARGEDLPFRDDRFDSVVCGLVLCSVDDPGAVLDEVARVLRPGGELRIFEHVANDGWRVRLQRAVAPIWSRLAGGCRLTRRTDAAIAAHPAFDPVEVVRLDIGVLPVKPFVRARFRRRA